MGASTLMNYYEILGVAPDASVSAIRGAYLSRIAHYHPDRNSSIHATAIAALLNEAWEVLGDSARRREYDATADSGGEQPPHDALSGPIEKDEVQPVSADGSNRRVSTRLKTLFTVWVTNPPKALYATSTCVDLSTTGLAFTLASPFQLDSSVTLTLDLPSGALEAKARVVRCDPLKRRDRWKVAVTFTSPGAHLQREIAAFIRWEQDSRLE
jgi:hypothetical protein